MKKIISALTLAVSLWTMADAYNVETAVQNCIDDVVALQQWPWANTVTVTFKVSGLEATNAVDVALTGVIEGTEIEIPPSAVKGLTRGLIPGGYSVSFNPMDVPALVERKAVSKFQVRVVPTLSAIDPTEPLYLIVDLESGTHQYLSRLDILSGAYGAYERHPAWIQGCSALNDCLIWTGVTADNAYRTTKLVLRRIPAGTFTMGSPSDEVERYSNEDRHQVTLTKDHWIGVFECTQKQYELIMGSNPSGNKGDRRPVEKVTYQAIRGNDAGAKWPNSSDVDADSFLGKLRAKTGLALDLPTEAVWEYACRAGTTTSLYTGENLTDATTCPNLAEVGRYGKNQNDAVGGYNAGATTVGSYKPNAWGLYDMLGNIQELCLDWWMNNLGTAATTDPVGGTRNSSNPLIVRRSGSWYDSAKKCRAAYREYIGSGGAYNFIGFRIALPIVE